MTTPEPGKPMLRVLVFAGYLATHRAERDPAPLTTSDA